MFTCDLVGRRRILEDTVSTATIRRYSVIMREVTHGGHSLSEWSRPITESQGEIIVFEL